jgi:hypothetical protein
MAESKTKTAAGTDWTGLLADPDLARNLGKLLQTYRDASPERREQSLLAAMREIKQGAAAATNASTNAKATKSGSPSPLPQETLAAPPFEPDIFASSSAEDRRRHPRIRCFVAVELRVNDQVDPIWGNLSNTSRGGCQVETATSISSGANVEIGLWVSSGKIWVKGVALNGVVTRTVPSGGVRIRFAGLDNASKENLRQFLKYVQEATKASRSESSYLQLLK